ERIIVTKQDTSVAGAVLSDGRRQRLHLSGKLGESQPPPAAGERQRIAAVAHMLGKRRSDEAHVREISALGRPRAIDWATMAAATALIRSPGMNTVTALAAASRSSPAISASPEMPKAYSTMTPPPIAAARAAGNTGKARVARMTRPQTKAATGKPTRKPTDGPANAPSPPRPPARSGAPSATTNRNRRTASAPR